jgi:YbbR domain-containing protein
VRRVLRSIAYNWPLKLGAIVLASLLYGGLVLSQSARTYRNPVPIEPANSAADLYIVSDLGAVTSIQYIAPEDLRVDATTFHATVDFSTVDPGAGSVSLPVRLSTSDPSIQVVDFEPRRITVTVDRVTSRVVPVHVQILSVPPGFDLGDPVTDDSTATVRGPESVVSQVTEVLAQVPIDTSGIDVNRTVTLVPVDASGNVLRPLDVEPASTRVRVPVFTDRRTRTLPVSPVVTGTPAAGFEVASIEVQPQVVSVEGDANDLAGLDRADTGPISISGASSDVVATVPLNLPDGVQALGSGSVDVTVHLRPVTATRTFEAGLVLLGAAADKEYALSTDRVLVTIGGSVAELDRLSGSSLALTLDVAGLGDGRHQVAPEANLTTGLSLIAVSPTPVTVTITSPPASPAPSPPAPSPS